MTGNSALQELFDACGTAELVAQDVRISSTALHHGANDWSRALRRAGIARGDRVICALPNGAAFAQLLIAALADGVTLAPVPEHEDVVPLLESLDARVAIATSSSHTHVAVPSRSGGPPGGPIAPRVTQHRTDAIAFLLRTSGTTSQPRWVAVPDKAVLSVLQSHLPFLGMDGSSALCVLPWHHAFGLVLGLIPALLRARRIVTTTGSFRETSALIALTRGFGITHFNMVPLIAQRLSLTEDGRRTLSNLHGGVIGGAAIDAALAVALTGTRLRVGYGQTEAGPGIMLGNPGEFHAGFIGMPVGCEVQIEGDGVLSFRGDNACDGYWEAGTLRALPANRWHRTDDLVQFADGAYTFVGRASANFKLANGRVVDAARLEAQLRAAHPTLTEVVLTTTDGTGIDVLYSTHDERTLGVEEFRDVLGGLRTYLHDVSRIGADAWTRSPKGEIDRRHLPSRA